MIPYRDSPPEVQAARNAYQRFLAHRADFERSFLDLGADILWFQENEAWTRLGFDTMGEFLTAPLESGGCGLSLTVSTALKRAAVFRKFVRELKIPEERLVKIGTAKLQAILPVTDRENFPEMLDKAESLALRDLEREIHGDGPTYDPPKVGEAIRLWHCVCAPPEYLSVLGHVALDEHTWVCHIPAALLESALKPPGDWTVGEVRFGQADAVMLQDRSMLFVGKPCSP